MIDYFAALNPTGDPAVDVQQFYRAAGRLDTLAHVTQVATEAGDLAARVGADCAAANLAARLLDDAALVYLDFLLDNGWRYGWVLHPNAVAAYRDLVGRANR